MRICAVSLPELRIEVAGAFRSTLANEGEALLAVVVAPPPMTETKLLGNTRLSVVSREARALGVHPGQTIAQARARAGNLTVRVVRPEAVHEVLARLAEVGLAFGATVSFAATEVGDFVWVDVTGCAHLHAPHSIFDGETILASRLASVIGSLGFTCSVAIADGPRVAAMLAREAAESAARLGSKRRARDPLSKIALELGLEPTIVRPGDNAAAIASLSVAMLPLPAEDVRWLSKIGVRTIDELRALPRGGLATRLGARARDVLALAFGEDRAPLTPYVPPRVPEEEAELEYGIEGTQALTFVAKTLTDRLSARLQGRSVAAARVELELRLDKAVQDDDSEPRDPASSDRVEVALDLPAPLSTASDLLAALRPKIERLVLRAPVLGAKLRAPVLVHKRTTALSLFEPQPKAERALPRLVAELVSDLGPEAVSTLTLGDSWVPEDRSRLVPFQKGVDQGDKIAAKEPVKKKKRRHLLSSVPEPTRMLSEAYSVPRESVRITRHLTRLESIEWWRSPPSPGENQRRPLDFVQGWTDDGEALIEIDRTSGAMRVRGWFD